MPKTFEITLDDQSAAAFNLATQGGEDSFLKGCVAQAIDQYKVNDAVSKVQRFAQSSVLITEK